MRILVDKALPRLKIRVNGQNLILMCQKVTILCNMWQHFTGAHSELSFIPTPNLLSEHLVCVTLQLSAEKKLSFNCLLKLLLITSAFTPPLSVIHFLDTDIFPGLMSEAQCSNGVTCAWTRLYMWSMKSSLIFICALAMYTEI